MKILVLTIYVREKNSDWKIIRVIPSEYLEKLWIASWSDTVHVPFLSFF